MSWVARPSSGQSSGRAEAGPAAVLFPSIADEFLESYVCWREACADVGHAYECWGTCALPERGLAFETYRAALDREQHAAHVHSVWAQRLHALER